MPIAVLQARNISSKIEVRGNHHTGECFEISSAVESCSEFFIKDYRKIEHKSTKPLTKAQQKQIYICETEKLRKDDKKKRGSSKSKRGRKKKKTEFNPERAQPNLDDGNPAGEENQPEIAVDHSQEGPKSEPKRSYQFRRGPILIDIMKKMNFYSLSSREKRSVLQPFPSFRTDAALKSKIVYRKHCAKAQKLSSIQLNSYQHINLTLLLDHKHNLYAKVLR